MPADKPACGKRANNSHTEVPVDTLINLVYAKYVAEVQYPPKKRQKKHQ
jgi:hypothetical protein